MEWKIHLNAFSVLCLIGTVKFYAFSFTRIKFGSLDCISQWFILKQISDALTVLQPYGGVCVNIIYANDTNTRNREINGCNEVRTTDINISEKCSASEGRSTRSQQKNEQTETTKKIICKMIGSEPKPDTFLFTAKSNAHLCDWHALVKTEQVSWPNRQRHLALIVNDT